MEKERTGQIVVIEPTVVESGGHIFGNLFQRLYHSIDRLRRSDEPAARELEGSARQLEDCVQLLMDYMAPYDPVLQDLDAGEIVESLTHRLQDETGYAVHVEDGTVSGAQVLADVGRLSRAYGLLAARLRGAPGSDVTLHLTAQVSSVGELEMKLDIPETAVGQRTSVAELEWAVAARLFEIHGGGLTEQTRAPGGIRWELVLPLRS